MIENIIYITSEWFTYEELDDRIKNIIPELDESKTKTYIIESYFFDLKDSNIQKKYYDR